MKLVIAIYTILMAAFLTRGSQAQSSRHEVNTEIYTRFGPYPTFNASTTFVFPAKDTNKERENSSNRTAIDDKRLCKDNELLYPGDQEGDWICDCKPGYLYDPQTSLCYEAYTRGPCQSNEILVLDKRIQLSPFCKKNKCKEGLIEFKGGCFQLHSTEACLNYQKLIGRDVFLAPDPTTLQLTCADHEFEFACVDRCCSGSKRDFRVREVCARPNDEDKN